MIAAIHQPNFLPWLGYFAKMAAADRFVFLDGVPFSKGSYTNRVRILKPSEPGWLTVPVETAGKLGQPIADVTCSSQVDWRSRTRSAVAAAYGRSPHYQPYGDELGDVLADSSDNLADLNIRLIGYLADKLGIDTPTIRSSDMSAGGEATDLLVNLCRELGATTYLSGSGGSKYQAEEAFERADIELRYANFRHPEYHQGSSEFHPRLSAIDLLFNAGPEAQDVFWDAARSR